MAETGMKRCGPWNGLWIILATLLVAGACGPSEDLRPPERSEVRAVLERVFCEPRPARGELPLAGADLEEDTVQYREATDRELEELFLPPPASEVDIEVMQSRFYPTWEVRFERISEGGESAPWHADVIELEGELRVLVHWWPALELEDGSRRPDFRPNPGGGADAGHVTVAARPPWVRLPYPVGFEPR